MKKVIIAVLIGCVGITTVYGRPHHHHPNHYKGQDGVRLAAGIINCVGNVLTILNPPQVIVAPPPVVPTPVVVAPPPVPAVVAPPPPVVVTPVVTYPPRYHRVVVPKHMHGPVYNNGYVPHPPRHHRHR